MHMSDQTALQAWLVLDFDDLHEGLDTTQCTVSNLPGFTYTILRASPRTMSVNLPSPQHICAKQEHTMTMGQDTP